MSGSLCQIDAFLDEAVIIFKLCGFFRKSGQPVVMKLFNGFIILTLGILGISDGTLVFVVPSNRVLNTL